MFNHPDFQAVISRDYVVLDFDIYDFVRSTSALRSVDYVIDGNAASGKTAFYIRLAKIVPNTVICVLSNNLKNELIDRLANEDTQATVLTFHVALLVRCALMIIDEIYALPTYLINRLAARAQRCIGFGDSCQIRDPGTGALPDPYLRPGDFFFNNSWSVPTDIMRYGREMGLTYPNRTSSAKIHESMFSYTPDVSVVFPTALRICFVRECLDSGSTSQTIQGLRSHVSIVHLCSREHLFINTPFFWTAITRASHATFFSVSEHTLEFLPSLPRLTRVQLEDLRNRILGGF
jgi:hypothetical protein